jgi:hypothetical protein
MGKQSQLRKRRKVDLLPNSISEVDQLDILTTQRTLLHLATNPALLALPALRGVRTAIHGVAVTGGSLSSRISSALEQQRWNDAIALLLIVENAPKLGTLQRWVRFCDAVGNAPHVLRVLDAILRCGIKLPDPIVNLEPWEPCQKMKHSSFTLEKIENKLEKEQDFKVVLHQLGKDRKLKNKFDFTLYLSNENTIKFNTLTMVEKKLVPNVKGAFVLTNVLGLYECNQILNKTETIGYTPDCPIVETTDNSSHQSVLAHNFFWLSDDSFLNSLYERIKPFLPIEIDGMELTGINPRFRLYRYVNGIYCLIV